MEQEKKVSLKINPIYIVVLFILILVIVTILIYFKYYNNEEETNDVDKFILDFKGIINEYYNSDTQTNEEIDLEVPFEIEEICFVNPDKSISGNVDQDLKILLQSNKNYNMFTLPIKSFKLPYHRINHLIILEENPLCIKTNKKLNAYVKITNFNNLKYIELYTKLKSTENKTINENIQENKTIPEDNTNINQCTGLCKQNNCDGYDVCMNLSGNCNIGYCCYGTCIEKQTIEETNKTLCQNAVNSDLCFALDLAYGSDYKNKCCSEYKLCC